MFENVRKSVAHQRSVKKAKIPGAKSVKIANNPKWVSCGRQTSSSGSCCFVSIRRSQARVSKNEGDRRTARAASRWCSVFVLVRAVACSEEENLVVVVGRVFSLFCWSSLEKNTFEGNGRSDLASASANSIVLEGKTNWRTAVCKK